QSKPAEPTAMGTATVDFTLEPRQSGGFVGTVTDGTDPIEDICVDILDATGTAVPNGAGPIATAPDGTFSGVDLEPGDYTLLFWDCDYTRVPAFATLHYGASPSFAHATTFTITDG